MSDLPPPGTPVDLHVIENRASLGQAMFTRMRERVADQPADVAREAAQWWFMLGWMLRGVAVTMPDDPDLIERTFLEIQRATAAKAEEEGWQ